MPDINTNLVSHFDLSKNFPLTPYSVPLVLWDIVENAWSNREVIFTEAWPKKDVTGPTVAWKVYRRVPGRVGLETLKPRNRGIFADEKDDTVLLEQWAQWMTIIYQFDIFHVSNQEVNKVMEEFEELMFNTTYVLKQLGVSEWLFDEQPADEELGRDNTQDLYRRTLRYRCILERKYIKTVPKIDSIWIQTPSSEQLLQNEAVVRNPNSTRDILSNRWVSSVLYADTKLVQNTPSSGLYVSGVDFNVVVDMPNGKSYVEWTPQGRHPAPGVKYYITYVYRDLGIKTPVTEAGFL